LFPGVEPLPPVRFEEFTAGHFVSLLDLAHLTGTDLDGMITLNPALHQDVARGELLIPATYPLRVPERRRGDFEGALAQLPASRKRDRQLSVSYRVRRGDTLSGIARQFGTSTSALQRANGLPRANRIYPGQVLEVRNGSGSWTPLVWTPEEASAAQEATEVGHVHVVRSGETIARIASRYGLTVAALVAANELASPDRIPVGLQLLIPGPVRARE
jgi:LysM repeat protein